jgi:hypothetical protein
MKDKIFFLNFGQTFGGKSCQPLPVIKNVFRKKIFYLLFCMGTREGYKKSIFNTPKVKKKTKIHMGSIRQSL